MATHIGQANTGMTVLRLCAEDARWRLVEVDGTGGWQRAEFMIAPDRVVSRIELRCPQRRREPGLLAPSPNPHTQVQGLLLSTGGVIIGEVLGTEEMVVANVGDWLANIEAGRSWNARRPRVDTQPGPPPTSC